MALSPAPRPDESARAEPRAGTRAPILPTPRQPAVGMVVPYDMALDRELRRFSGDAAGDEQLDLLFTRTRFEPMKVTVRQARAISKPRAIADCTRSIAETGPEATVYGCTSGSFIRGRSGEQALRRAMRAAVPVPAFTTSGALLDAVRTLGAETIATATPYDDAITAQFAAFFAEAGVHLVNNANLGLSGRIWTVSPERTYDLVRAADSDGADAVVISCTNLPTYEVLDALEHDLGKPVLSANQATLWQVMRHLDVPYAGPGAALRATPRLPAPEPAA